MAVAAAILGAYWGGLDGDFVWDDDSLLEDNPEVHERFSFGAVWHKGLWSGLANAGEVRLAPLYSWLHRPVVQLYFGYGWRWFHGRPFGFHVASLAVHLLTTAIAVVVAVRRRPAPADREKISALLVVGILALHPGRAESVAWISAMFDLGMSACVLVGVSALTTSSGRSAYLLGFVALVLGGWFKETAIVAPALIVTEAYGSRRPWRDVVRPFSIACAAALVVVVTWRRAIAETAAPSSSLEGGSFIERVVATFGVMLERLFYPLPATAYPGSFIRDDSGNLLLPTSSTVLGAFGLIVIAAVVFASLRRGELRGVVADLAWIVVPFVPVSNLLLRSGQALYSDRFLTLPLYGLAFLILRFVCSGLSRGWVRAPILVASGGLVASLAFFETRGSVDRFADDVTLMLHEVRLAADNETATEVLLEVLGDAGSYGFAADLALQAASRAHERGVAGSEARFLLHYLRARTMIHRESEQESLLAIRRAFDSIAEGEVLRIDLPDLRIEQRLAPGLLDSLRNDASRYRIPRIVAHLRTLDFDGARGLARDLLAHESTNRTAVEFFAIATARAGDLDGAARILARYVEDVGRFESVESALERIESVRPLATRSIDDPLRDAVRDANVATHLGSPELARRRLAPLLAVSPQDPILLAALANAELADSDLEVAERIVRLGLAVHPDDPSLATVARALVNARRSRGPRASGSGGR